MKITHNKVGQNLNLTDTGKTDKADASKKTTNKGPVGLEDLGSDVGASKVDLSPRALEAKRIKDLAMAAPDVDEAKVAKFRALIDSGKYKIDADAVADRMVDEHLETAE